MGTFAFFASPSPRLIVSLGLDDTVRDVKKCNGMIGFERPWSSLCIYHDTLFVSSFPLGAGCPTKVAVACKALLKKWSKACENISDAELEQLLRDGQRMRAELAPIIVDETRKLNGDVAPNPAKVGRNSLMSIMFTIFSDPVWSYPFLLLHRKHA